MNVSESKAVAYYPEEAVMMLQSWFHRKAWRFSRENRSLLDDLVQEMSTGVLCCEGEHPLLFYKEAGVGHAKMFLRAEARQEMRRMRFARLKHTVTHGGEVGFIEGLIDLHDAISSRPEAPVEVPELCADVRKSA